jgi:L-rhamnose isomerase/sugar isomerase
MSKPLEHLADEFGAPEVEAAVERVATLPIEVPSWGFGRGGTRFEVYRSGNEPSTATERIEAAGQLHRLTGKGGKVALHFPWDASTKAEVRGLKTALGKVGLKAGSVNSNLFSMRDKGRLDAKLRFGSLTNPDKIIREEAVRHNIECLEYARILGSDTLVLWVPDGTNSPGQMSMYDQADRLEASLKEIYADLAEKEKLLIEYKLFEPGFYSTAIQDYGRSLYLAWLLGDKAKVLVDLGHHAHGVNVEQIVAHLLRQGKLGGFHFNDSSYADDDLAAGSINPHRLFRIFVNLFEGELRGYTPIADLALMIDQSHNIKDPVEELIESIENIEAAYAKAMLVDFDAVSEAQDSLDPSTADRLLMSAFMADVRPILREARRRQDVTQEPLLDYRLERTRAKKKRKS